jgi:hypothetical protein
MCHNWKQESPSLGTQLGYPGGHKFTESTHGPRLFKTFLGKGRNIDFDASLKYIIKEHWTKSLEF